MKKIKEFIAIVKIELILCIAVPIITAVLLSQSQTLSSDIFYMSMVGLFCVLTYGLIKMYFKLKKKDVIVREENLNKPKSTKYRVFVLITAIILPLAGLSVNGGFGFMGRGNGGRPSAADLTYLRRALIGSPGHHIRLFAADLNRDGMVNAADITFLRRHLLDPDNPLYAMR